MSNEKLNTLAVFGVFMMIMGIFLISSNYAEAKIDQNMCKQMYERYVDLKEQKFREKYSGRSFVNDCIKLYKNPDWYFTGKSKIDSNYAKIESQMGNSEKKIDINVVSYMPIGTEKFLVKFRACASESSQQTSFLVKSKIDQYIATTSKVLQKGKCNDYNVTVKSKQITGISIEYISDVSKYNNIKSGPLRI